MFRCVFKPFKTCQYKILKSYFEKEDEQLLFKMLQKYQEEEIIEEIELRTEVEIAKLTRGA